MANRAGSAAKSSSRRGFTLERVTTPMAPRTALPTKFAAAEKHMARFLRYPRFLRREDTEDTCVVAERKGISRVSRIYRELRASSAQGRNLSFDQERIALAFRADGSQAAMAGDDHGFIRQRQHGVVQRAHDFLHGAAGQVGASDGTGEESVAGNQFFFGGKIEADAAFRVSGRVQ